MPLLRKALTALLFTATACVHVPPASNSAEAVAREYATRLAAGELDRAWALSTGVSRETFLARYADANERAHRANAVAHAASGEVGAGGVQLTFGNEGWRVLEAPEAPRSDADLQRVLSEFLDAAERRDFPAAWTMLSAKWRARYTPARLQSDFDAEPQVKERLARARAALTGPWKVERDSAALGLGEGRTLRLEREGEIWRVAALE